MKFLAPILLALSLALPLAAEVKLTTLPDRERVVVRFEDNGRVLVEELAGRNLHAPGGDQCRCR